MAHKFSALGPLLTALIAPHAHAAEIAETADFSQLKAVSAPNGKLELGGGSVNERFLGLVGMSVALPLGASFGTQIDGSVGTSGEDAFAGVGGHLFWRDPETLLLGATGMLARFDDSDETLYRAGVEAEWYLMDVTLFAAGGAQWDANDPSAYGTIGASYYATPDLVLTAKASGFDDYYNFQAGVEYRPSMLAGGSLFVNGGIDDDSQGFAMAGLRFSFGGSGKTLKQRDRYDDPVNLVTDLMNASAGKIRDRTRHALQPASSGGGGGGGGGCGGGICC